MAMLRNMVTSLLEHERIVTTVPKAKEARRLAEKTISLAKRGGLSNLRLAARTVKSREVLKKVFGELKERYANRPGGYTRIMQIGFRRGDSADMAIVELVDRKEKPKSEKAAKKEAAKESQE